MRLPLGSDPERTHAGGISGLLPLDAVEPDVPGAVFGLIDNAKVDLGGEIVALEGGAADVLDAHLAHVPLLRHCLWLKAQCWIDTAATETAEVGANEHGVVEANTSERRANDAVGRAGRLELATMITALAGHREHVGVASVIVHQSAWQRRAHRQRICICIAIEGRVDGADREAARVAGAAACKGRGGDAASCEEAIGVALDCC